MLSPFGWGEICYRDFEATLGGNLLLVLATILYFYNPAFKEFISTVGKGSTHRIRIKS